MCGLGTAILGGGAISGISSLFAGSQQASAANNAAQLQANAEAQAVAAQQANFAQVTQNLSPFVQGGTQVFNQLVGGLSNFQQPFQAPSPYAAATTYPYMQLPTNLNQLAQTPGYQFTLQQGLEATQNSFAGQGLGTSGAAMKGAANYAEGLASTTYQQQFQNAINANQLALNQNTLVSGAAGQANAQQMQQELQNFNMLYNIGQTGAQAATNQGQFGTQTAANIGNALQGSALAQGQYLTGGAARHSRRDSSARRMH